MSDLRVLQEALEDTSSTFRYWADVTSGRDHDDPGEFVTTLMDRVLPGIDLLPPGARMDGARVHVSALLAPEDVETLVRAGLTVVLTGYREGPADRSLAMDDQENRDPLLDKLGAERLRRGGR